MSVGAAAAGTENPEISVRSDGEFVCTGSRDFDAFGDIQITANGNL